MPHKSCPECKKECGPRTKECPECQYDFSSSTTKTEEKEKVKTSPSPKTKRKKLTKKSKTLIGIGSWINDTTKGMPKIEYPEPLSCIPGLLTIEDISNQCAYEGMPFCVYEYIPANRIEDKKLAKMWSEASKKLIEITHYILDKEIEQ